ncbi:hypothetical protein MKZ38_008990 [Zalerion maritima]|uniref:Uncharacterized protein n=1 Tax=Zalerion maritima TaxID=339359 RepID=A0AAD5RGW5_9PEZI|nr:hypothetical protein MKZ38_008990 [Zalerion maritima]
MPLGPIETTPIGFLQANMPLEGTINPLRMYIQPPVAPIQASQLLPWTEDLGLTLGPDTSNVSAYDTKSRALAHPENAELVAQTLPPEAQTELGDKYYELEDKVIDYIPRVKHVLRVHKKHVARLYRQRRIIAHRNKIVWEYIESEGLTNHNVEEILAYDQLREERPTNAGGLRDTDDVARGEYRKNSAIFRGRVKNTGLGKRKERGTDGKFKYPLTRKEKDGMLDMVDKRIVDQGKSWETAMAILAQEVNVCEDLRGKVTGVLTGRKEVRSIKQERRRWIMLRRRLVKSATALKREAEKWEKKEELDLWQFPEGTFGEERESGSGNES